MTASQNATSAARVAAVISILALAIPFVAQQTKQQAGLVGLDGSLAVGVSYIFVIAATAGLWRLANLRSANLVPWRRPKPLSTHRAFVGLFGALCGLLVVLYLARFAPREQTTTVSPELLTASSFLALVGALLLAPIAEEVLFRRVIYRLLRGSARQPWSVAGAIVVSSILFGLSHYMVSGPTTIVYIAVVGVVLALSYELTGLLRVPILIHMIHNFHVVADGSSYTVQLIIYGLLGSCLVSLYRAKKDIRATLDLAQTT